MKRIIIFILLSCLMAIGGQAQEKPAPPKVTILDSICEVEVLSADFTYKTFDFEHLMFDDSDVKLVMKCKQIDHILIKVEGGLFNDCDIPFYFGADLNNIEDDEGITINGDTIRFDNTHFLRNQWDWGERWTLMFQHYYEPYWKTVAISEAMITSDYVTDQEVRDACLDHTGISAPYDGQGTMPHIDDNMLYPEGNEVKLYTATGLLVKAASGTQCVSLTDLPSGVYIVKTNNKKTFKVKIK